MCFQDFDFSNFWESNEYSQNNYVSDNFTEEAIEHVEKQTGYKLPESYIELLRNQNGGIPKNLDFPTTKRTSWADNHIRITGIFGISVVENYKKHLPRNSLECISEWKYPNVGIYFADTPTAGHTMVCLYYKNCGENGEPQVAFIDERSRTIVIVAQSFEEFIKGLTTVEDL
ncbi:hypothetical protein M0813_19984 [Anaeramoeba flamelloides]|uniref:Knr4/Smi1-like domain-containing protein n=1 Tax=Anaeramoeba flamelloides TaxID=1746091 RepID=A0AAV8A094_9EUKA|nr:hypothetical protein M0812_08265 [Anaeramoeba flamelloides]KAJ6245565.1 hypothetical protein M0813_19984 [Anaeramoeba flamelloides]|eukprot:Anaeramoba_flamelloidesa577940_33.p1 GENE.a577940_33~~a577940_33.p1  ORF type:complete len:181 (+),score=37.55 a577940_33:30-545(+)